MPPSAGALLLAVNGAIFVLSADKCALEGPERAHRQRRNHRRPDHHMHPNRRHKRKFQPQGRPGDDKPDD